MNKSPTRPSSIQWRNACILLINEKIWFYCDPLFWFLFSLNNCSIFVTFHFSVFIMFYIYKLYCPMLQLPVKKRRQMNYCWLPNFNTRWTFCSRHHMHLLYKYLVINMSTTRISKLFFSLNKTGKGWNKNVWMRHRKWTFLPQLLSCESAFWWPDSKSILLWALYHRARYQIFCKANSYLYIFLR